tara:strand:- start:526 stop:1020 length:495 start_codon:yes stop_codon:yes gene_type:complete
MSKASENYTNRYTQLKLNRMKLILTLLLNLIVIISFSQSKYTWEKYENPLLIKNDSTANIDDFENTPESIVTYFYASKIRKDSKWEKVIPNEDNRSENLKKELSFYENFAFTQFQLVSKTEYSKNELGIKVFFEIEYDGKKKSGTDGVTVKLINGKWLITNLPM